jgi:hypothetical protein
MPYTMEDFTREFTEEHLHLLPPEKVLRQFSLEQRLEGLSLDEISAYLESLKNQQKPAN